MDKLKSLIFCTFFFSLIFSMTFVSAFEVEGKASCSIESELPSSVGCCEGLEEREGSCQKIPGVEVCDNKEDDDGDDLVDCLDSKCKESVNCGGDKDFNVGYPKEINYPFIAFVSLVVIVVLIVILILRRRKK